MRMFRNVKEAMVEIERELFEMGINNHPRSMQDLIVEGNDEYNTKELMGYCYSLSDWNDIEDIFESFTSIGEIGNEYCKREHADRISNLALNPGNSWKLRPGLWSKFLHAGKFSYTYSERFTPQLDNTIALLNNDKGSRQAIITMYDYHSDMMNRGGTARVPCSLTYQFLLRKVGGRNLLTLIYTMRSCDYYNHFPIDVKLAIMLLEYVAEKVEAIPSNFIHFIGSLHAYQKDFVSRRIF